MPRAGSAQYRPTLTVLVTVTAACLLFAQGAAAAVTTIGGPGVGPGTFAVPGADALDSAGALYVLDPFRGTLQKFSNEGGFAEEVEQANGLPLPTDNVAGIAIDAANRVFVADPSNKRLIELNSSLGYEATIAGGVEPIAVATGDGFIYTLSVNAGQYRIQQYVDNPPTFTVGVSRTFATGSGPEDLAAPNTNGAIHDQLAVDAGGTVYVTDADNQRVIELNDALNVLPNRLTGISGYALAIATGQVAGETQVYVGDDNYAGSAYVRRYSPSGALLGSFAVPGAHGGLATDASGDVFDSEGFANGDVLRIDTTPDPAIAATPASGLTSQTVTFSGAGSETDLWSVADYSWSLEGSSGFPTDTLTSPTVERQFNAPGTYPISLQVTATNGRVAQTTVDYVVGNSGAAFTSPIHALTGTPVSFDGSASAIPYSKVTDYAWDFDGSSNYADDGGTAPTISHTFTTPGTYTVQLRVTRAGGRVDLASATIVVAPQPPPGIVGVSIDEGDYATDDPHVQVGLVWPSFATQALISNDGGFGAAGGTSTLALASQLPWTLEQTGPERLPKTVYVRFLGAGIDTQNFTDDIILDQTPPTLESALLLGGAGAEAASLARAGRHTYKIKVDAHDKLVGVCAVDASARKSGGTVVTVKSCRGKGILRLAKTVTVKASARPHYVRVRNSAGDWSRWLALGG
jgi:PKD repeat protein